MAWGMELFRAAADSNVESIAESSREIVEVKEILEGDSLRLVPLKFAYVLLETRGDIFYDDMGIHFHFALGNFKGKLIPTVDKHFSLGETIVIEATPHSAVNVLDVCPR